MLRIIVFIICFFLLLVHFRSIKKETENFISNIKQYKVEHFEDEVSGSEDIPSVKDMGNEEVEKADEDSYEQPLDPKKKKADEADEDNTVKADSNEVCQKNKGAGGKEGTEDAEGCLFGCPKGGSKETNIDEMLTTIDETEKICDLIEKKDRTRKEVEDKEAIEKQIELNKKFLVQQKAQDKQIKDLEEIIKSMSFTQEMNKAAVEKCGKHNSDCLSEKEQDLKKLLLQKQAQSKNVKVNINLKDFGREFLTHLMNKVGLNNEEINNLLSGLNNGSMNLPGLRNQMGFNNSKFNSGKYMDDSECPTCEVDLSEYIDRCKIPCHKCRDPMWKCPQDTKN